jgi:VIT family
MAAGGCIGRGLDPLLARQVADQLMAHDALGAHARDELGISETQRARPIQAALASAGSFAVGAGLPLFVTALAGQSSLLISVSATSLLFLALLGALAARVGGAPMTAGAIRVTFWGALAMGVTAGVGGVVRNSRLRGRRRATFNALRSWKSRLRGRRRDRRRGATGRGPHASRSAGSTGMASWRVRRVVFERRRRNPAERRRSGTGSRPHRRGRLWAQPPAWMGARRRNPQSYAACGPVLARVTLTLPRSRRTSCRRWC